MKVSIVIAILDSHEVVRRQIRHFEGMDLSDAVEIVFVDDGSEPPIKVLEPGLRNFRLLKTHDYRPWTQGLARMKGIAAARGEYILCTDIDHIISREAVDFALQFTGDKAIFQRRFAYLDEDGNLVVDKEKLLAWGLNPMAIRDGQLSDGVHGNTWLMRKSVFQELGGYSLKRCNSGTHLQGEDRHFNHRYNNAARAGKYAATVSGPPIYFFPQGRYHATGEENPHGLFHTMHKEKWGDA